MLTKFLGKALASMVLTKEAREVAGVAAKHAVRNATQKIQTGPGGKLPDTGLPALAEGQVPAEAGAPAPVDRAELIRRAMEVRKSQQSLLAELNPAQRAKLEETAMRAFLGEVKPKQ